MGAALSSNNSEQTQSIIANVASNQASGCINTQVSCPNNFVFGDDAKVGTIDLSNTQTMDSKCTINNLTTQTTQQSMTQDAIQKATSKISGIPIASIASASNAVKQNINATTNVTSNISNLCSNSQTCAPNTVEFGDRAQLGRLIEHNMQNFSSSCNLSSASNQATSQSADQAVKQAASATVVGINPLIILIAIIILVIGPIVGTGYAVSKGLKTVLVLLPIILLVIGLTLIVIGVPVNNASKGVLIYAYAQDITNDESCNPVVATGKTRHTDTDVTTLINDFKTKYEYKDYAGFQWKYEPDVNKYTTTFFSKFSFLGSVPCKRTRDGCGGNCPNGNLIYNCTPGGSCDNSSQLCGIGGKNYVCGKASPGDGNTWLEMPICVKCKDTDPDCDPDKECTATIGAPDINNVVVYRSSSPGLIYAGSVCVILAILLGIFSLLLVPTSKEKMKKFK